MIRPVRIFHDFDGVINVDFKGRWDRELSENYARIEDTLCKIRWAPDLIEELDSLPAQKFWCTTWRQDAVRNVAPVIGVGKDWTVVHPKLKAWEPTTYPSIYWKYVSVSAIHKFQPGPAIWLDDELAEEPEIRQSALNMGMYAPIIDPKYGITPKIVEEMKIYIDYASVTDYS